ncbi:10340_t:CDS:2, partial [Scutellospora calospora]
SSNRRKILHKSERQSLELWKFRIEKNSDLTCSVSQQEGVIGRLFGFTIPIRKEIIRDTLTILFDSIHGTNKDNDYLFTLLSPDPKTSKEQKPIVFLIDYDLAQIKQKNIGKVCKDKEEIINHKLNAIERRKLKEEVLANIKHLMQNDDIATVDS